jgi:hypothetical protein
MRGLLLVAVFPRLSANGAGLLFEFSGVCLHLLDSSEVLWNFQSIPSLI